MARIAPIDATRAAGRAKSLLSGLRAIRGGAGAMELALAASPAALESYVALLVALGGGALGTRLREQIALSVAQANGSRRSLAEHAVAARRAGLGEKEIADSRLASSDDPRADAALRFVHAVLALRGHVTDGDLARVREAGYTDGEVAEIVANVAFNVFINYFDNVARPELDLPRMDPVAAARAGGSSSVQRRAELLP